MLIDSGAMAATTRGVIASEAVTSSMLMMFWMISFSSSSNSPDSSATSAIAPTSSREIAVSEDLGVMSFWSPSTHQTRGKRSTIRTRIALAVNPISDFQ